MTSPAPSIATVTVSNVSRYGEVNSKDGLIEGFTEKRVSDKGGQINAGMYLLSSEPFNQCPKTNFSIETAILPKLICEKKLRATALDCDFIDIGIPEDYKAFCEWIR
jgi:NDP-sugar pyrophosphorylase family protein